MKVKIMLNADLRKPFEGAGVFVALRDDGCIYDLGKKKTGPPFEFGSPIAQGQDWEQYQDVPGKVYEF